ncbi:hypothetical protein [Microbacterium sp. SMR1]|uniref:hypothetical protein n=1 Tax=Microbacterium sp. SMR1 TaxID=1497340 RepID=UPI0011BF3C11|nr:hypothetical protein [Microbacterium sp. SMR1]
MGTRWADRKRANKALLICSAVLFVGSLAILTLALIDGYTGAVGSAISMAMTSGVLFWLAQRAAPLATTTQVVSRNRIALVHPMHDHGPGRLGAPGVSPERSE